MVPQPSVGNPVTLENKDPQVRIREGLKPDRLKMDFTPVEFRKWKAQIFFLRADVGRRHFLYLNPYCIVTYAL